MGFDYALVHLKYTIPPAIVLSLIYRPLLTRLDLYKIAFLVAIAVLSTIPWDSYLIRTNVWSYPSNVIIGPKLFDIPAEEVFFFVIQTYNTSLLYLLLSKPVFHPAYLHSEKKSQNGGYLRLSSWALWKRGGQATLALGIVTSIRMIKNGGHGTYLGLIVLWAFPFLLLLWSLAYQFLIGLPKYSIGLPIVIPTFYLWIVDTLALQRGTWVIESGTKTGLHLWPGLEIEEAFFFLVTNCLIVFGLVAFDHASAVLNACPKKFPTVPKWPSPVLLVQALLLPTSYYDGEYLDALREALVRLRQKSRSFYLASGSFQGRLRMDLILLYSYCRAADDLVDDSSAGQAKDWIGKMRKFLDISYATKGEKGPASTYADEEFPPRFKSAFRCLPTAYLSKKPLIDMLDGFEMDIAFELARGDASQYPIKSVSDLDLYGARVAGTVAESILELVFYHLPSQVTAEEKARLLKAGARMGIALQYVNISRDIAVDARIGRVYIPLDWLAEQDLTPAAVIKNPAGTRVEVLRLKLLARAFQIYEEARSAIEELPEDARGPMRVAVESYMEIGRVIREEGYQVRAGRATVPKRRRIRVAWRALNGPTGAVTAS
ncbi:Lycopene beta-cyclase [Phyllosticta capitalensis]|uniref:Bifunctional lycopene cyclase/phytoene synthase n=1 Tax=Phyllosticta capitalensis TaxID=121624 RepID=A0ABR1YIT1_9PEZI